ncbi:hypothetical protein ACIO93_03080 [Streptomyces sp. NPDC087903]|uniref:hypothetical protein n=1 Tax=Streptomyces sp. NPDC087903 TaxID=3365819 RepID=UPI00382ABF77
MSIVVSPQLNNLLFVLIGEKMLQADEDLAYASHKPYKRLGKNVRDLSDLIEQSVLGVGQSLPPQVGQQYVRAMRLFVDNGGTNYLREFSKQLDDVGDGRVKISMDIMEAKWQIIAELVRLLIELAIITALSFFTGGSAASQAATAKARSRVAILATLDQLLKRTHVLPSLSEAFDEAFQTFAVRLAMMTLAPPGRRPDNFDWGQIFQDGVFGAFTGLFHGAFDSLTKNLGKGFRNLLDGPGGNGFGKNNTKNITDDITSKFDNPPRSNSFGDRLTRGTGSGANEFLVAGGSEALAEVFVNGIFNGKWEGSWDTFLGAGLSSVVTSALFDSASKFGGAFRPGFDFGGVNVLPVGGADGTQASDSRGKGNSGGTRGKGTRTTSDADTPGTAGTALDDGAGSGTDSDVGSSSGSVDLDLPTVGVGGSGDRGGLEDVGGVGGVGGPGTVPTSSSSVPPGASSGGGTPAPGSGGRGNQPSGSNSNDRSSPNSSDSSNSSDSTETTATTDSTDTRDASEQPEADSATSTDAAEDSAGSSSPESPSSTSTSTSTSPSASASASAPDPAPIQTETTSATPVPSTAPVSSLSPSSSSSSSSPASPSSAPAGWNAARAAAPPVGRSHTWVDPVSTPKSADGRATQYVVNSGFDVRRFTHDGEPVVDLTVEVAFSNADAVPDAERQAVWERMTEGVQQAFNAPGHRLPSGERLHVTVVPAPPGATAHLTVELADPASGRRTSHHVWRTNGTATDFTHEIGHQLGLRDESRDDTAPQRPQVEGSLMGDYQLPVPQAVRTVSADEQADYAQGGMRPRHLALLHTLIGDPDDTTPPPRVRTESTGGADPFAPLTGTVEESTAPETTTSGDDLAAPPAPVATTAAPTVLATDSSVPVPVPGPGPDTAVPVAQGADSAHTAVTPHAAPALPAGWEEARSAATPDPRSHSWLDPVSTATNADGEPTQYMVHSGFDVRRFTHDGEPVVDLTIHLTLTHDDTIPDTQRQAVWDRMAQGVQHTFNTPRHRLPTGERLHVTIAPAPPGTTAHLTVELADPTSGRRTSHHVWRTNGTTTDFTHEIGHQLGLRDENRDNTAPQRPQIDGSLMGTYQRPVPHDIRTATAHEQANYTQGGLRPRHLALLHTLIGNPDDTTPPPHVRTTRATTGASPLAPVSNSDDVGTSTGPTTSLGAPQPPPPVRELLMHPGYATGDQFGIAAALLGDPALHVVVVGGPSGDGADSRDKGRDIAAFYLASGVPAHQVHFEEAATFDAGGIKTAAERAAGAVTAGAYGRLSGNNKKKFLIPVGSGTTWVAKHFSEQLRGRVRSAWGLDDTAFPSGDHSAVASWLAGRGITVEPGRETIVLWSRFSGKRGDVHVEHDTSYTGIDQILERIAEQPRPDGARPPLVIIAGDAKTNAQRPDKYPGLVAKHRGPNLEVHDLTDFWTDKEGVAAWGGDSRIGQMRLYEYLDRRSKGWSGGRSRLKHLGFRSGNLEALAMAGHTVRYMEEEGSQGGDRMAKWHAATEDGKTSSGGLAPGYERIHVTPPTRSGKYIVQIRKDVETYKTALKADRNNRELQNRIADPANDFHHPLWVRGKTDLRKGDKPAVIHEDVNAYPKGFTDQDLDAIAAYLRPDPETPEEAQIRLAHEAIAAVEADIAHLSGQLTLLEASRVEHRRRIAELNGEIENAGRRLRELESIVRSINRNLKVPKNAAPPSPGSERSDQQRARVASEDLARLNTELTEQRSALRQVNDELARTRVQLAGTSARLTDLRTAIHASRSARPAGADPLAPVVDTPDGSATPTVVPALPENWQTARAAALAVERSYTWVDEDSAPRATDGRTTPDEASSGFTVRRFSHSDVPIADLTVKVAFSHADGVPAADLQTVWDRLTEGVEQAFNAPGHRLPTGERVHLTVERVPPGDEAHLTVELADPDSGRPTSRQVWRTDGTAADLTHAFVRSLGLGNAPGAQGAPSYGTFDDLARLNALIGAPDPAVRPSMVIHQPGYATGDQFGIAAALLRDPHLHVVVVGGPQGAGADPRDKGRDIRDFYLAGGVPARQVHFAEATTFDSEGIKAAAEKETESVSSGYLMRLSKTKRKDYLVPVGSGTTLVAKHFDQDLRDRIRTNWRLDDAGFPPDQREAVASWLAGRGITVEPGRDTIVLWSRFSGKRGDVHVEHDTSYTGIDQILTSINERPRPGSDKGPLVIIAGDAKTHHELRDKYPAIVDKQRAAGLDVHDLTDFWTDREGVRTWGGDSRIGQMRLYEYLDRQSRGDGGTSAGLRHLGFRSGNLEALALAGHTVRYMEEEGSHGGERMAKWHAATEDGKTSSGGLAPGYERIQVTPPTRSGKYIVQIRNVLDGYKEQLRTDKKNETLKATILRTTAAVNHPVWVRGRENERKEDKPDVNGDPNTQHKGFTKVDLATVSTYLVGHRETPEQAQIRQTREAITVIEGEIDHLESEMAQLAARRSEHQRRIRQLTTEIRAARLRLRQLAAIVDDVNRRRYGTTTPTPTPQTERPDQTQARTASDHLTGLNTELSQQRTALREVTEELEQTRSAIADARVRVGQLRDAVAAAASSGSADPLAPLASPADATDATDMSPASTSAPAPTPIDGAAQPADWEAARSAATPDPRSHSWLDPVSTATNADGEPTQYMVHSGFDVRRFTHDGEPVVDLTIHLTLTHDDTIPDTQRQAVWDRMTQGVQHTFNTPRHRLPTGERLHVTIAPAPPGTTAHLTVELADPTSGRRTSHHVWRTNGTATDFTHEIGHQLGLRDENRDNTAPQRPQIDGSLMGTYQRPVPHDIRTATAHEQANYTQGGLRPRHLALLHTLIGNPDDTTPPPHVRTTRATTGASPLAPVTPSSYVQRYGTQRDGNVGLVQVEPLPAHVVEGLHEQVLRSLRITAPVAQDHPVRAELRRLLSGEQLVLNLPYLRSSMGHRVTVEVGGRRRTVDVRIALRDPVPSARLGSQDPSDPDVRVERRGLGTQEWGDSESSGNYRAVVVPWSASLPIPKAGPVRAWDFGPSLSLTHNQLSMSTSVTQVVQTTTAQRSNELSHAYRFDTDWEVRVDVPRMAPTDNWGVAEGHGPVTVWFPEHLAVDADAGTALPEPAELDALPLWGVDTVAEPHRLLEAVHGTFHTDLSALGESSAQELEAFLSEPVLRGTLPMQRSGGIFSPLLLDARGRAIGMLKVTTEVVPGQPTHRSLDGKINLESHLVHTVKVDGQAKITNAVGVDVGVGPAFTGSLAAGHPDASGMVAGGVLGKGGVRWQTSDTLGSGGSAGIMHALRTNRGHLLTPADIRHTVTLVRPGGGATTHTFDSWPNGMHLRLPAKPDAEGHPPAEDERRALPAELENLQSIGITTTPLTVEGPQQLFGHAEDWLRAHGYLPPRADAPVRNRVLPDEALVQAQLNNLRRFEQTRSDIGLRAATDAMVDGGHALWLERPTAMGTHRVKLNLTATRAPGTGSGSAPPSRHTRTRSSIQHVSLTSFGMGGVEQQSSGYGWSAGFGGSVSGPVGPFTKGSGTLGGAADHTFARQTTHTATAGSGLGHDQLFIGSNQGSEEFEVPALFALDLYDGSGAEPAVRFAEHTATHPYVPPGEVPSPAGPPPRTVAGTITLAVPHHRTLPAAPGTPAAPAPPPAVRRPDDADLDRLAMTGPDGSPVAGVVKLPDDAIVDVFRGSAALQEAIRQIAEGTQPGRPEPGLLAAVSGAASALSPQVLKDTASLLSSSLAGQSATDPTTLAAEVAQAALSPASLLARGHQIFKGAYVVEGITLPGLGADQDYSLEIRGVLRNPRHLHSAKQYLETGVVSVDSGAQQRSVGTSHQQGVAVTGTRTPATTTTSTPPPPSTNPDPNPSTAPTATAVPAPATANNASVAATHRPSAFGPSAKYTHTTRTENSATVSAGTSVNRTATESGDEHRITADATLLVTLRRGTRNAVGNTLGYGSDTPVTVAVDIPQAVQFLMTEGQLTRHQEWFAEVDGLTPSPAAAETLPLPQRFTRTGEPGLASVLSVTQLGGPAARPADAGAVEPPSSPATGSNDTPADRTNTHAPDQPHTAPSTGPVERRDRLRTELTALVEAEAPGVTRPGHSAYLPGVASRIADYTSTAGLRALPGRGPRGVQRFHFRHLALGGARLVEVTLTARPRGDANALRTVRGRHAGPGTGLEQYHAHAATGDTTGTTRTTQHGLTLNPTTRYPRPEHDTRTDRTGPVVNASSTRSHGTKAVSTAEDRFWLRTDNAADFDLDYDYEVAVRSELVADWPPNVIGGLLQGGILAYGDQGTESGDGTASWISRVLGNGPYRRASVPATVTLRFTGSEATTAEDVEGPRPPTVGAAPPDLSGGRFVPTGPAPVFEFNAGDELSTALGEVAPRQARTWRSLKASTSAESTTVRIGELIQAGDIALDHPRTAAGLTGTMPGAYPFESDPAHPPTLAVSLHHPRRVTQAADVTLDRLRVSAVSGGSSRSGGTTGGLGFQGAYSHDDTNQTLGGATVPVLTRQPQTAGTTEGAGGGRREWLKTGTTAAPTDDDSHGTRTYEALVDTHITVRGPQGVRHVTGTATVRIGERDALGHGITPPRTHPQVYDLPSMVHAAADAEARTNALPADRTTPDAVPDTAPETRPGIVADSDLRDWRRHPLRGLPSLLASQIADTDQAAQLWLALDTDPATRSGSDAPTMQQDLGRALFAASRAAALTGKPIELVVRGDDNSLRLWNFDAAGAVQGLPAEAQRAWQLFDGQATALTTAAETEHEARRTEFALGREAEAQPARVADADEAVRRAAENVDGIREASQTAEERGRAAREAVELAERDGLRSSAEITRLTTLATRLTTRIGTLDGEMRAAEVALREAEAVVTSIERNHPAEQEEERPDQVRAREAAEALERLRGTREEDRTELDGIRAAMGEERRSADATERALPGLLSQAEQAHRTAERHATDLTDALERHRTAQRAAQTARQRLRELPDLIQATRDRQATATDAQTRAEQQLLTLAATVPASPRVEVPTGSLASTSARWPRPTPRSTPPRVHQSPQDSLVAALHDALRTSREDGSHPGDDSHRDDDSPDRGAAAPAQDGKDALHRWLIDRLANPRGADAPAAGSGTEESIAERSGAPLIGLPADGDTASLKEIRALGVDLPQNKQAEAALLGDRLTVAAVPLNRAQRVQLLLNRTRLSDYPATVAMLAAHAAGRDIVITGPGTTEHRYGPGSGVPMRIEFDGVVYSVRPPRPREA